MTDPYHYLEDEHPLIVTAGETNDLSEDDCYVQAHDKLTTEDTEHLGFEVVFTKEMGTVWFHRLNEVDT